MFDSAGSANTKLDIASPAIASGSFVRNTSVRVTTPRRLSSASAIAIAGTRCSTSNLRTSESGVAS